MINSNLSTKETIQFNDSTRIVATNICVTLSIAGALGHGLFEILQGNKSTESAFINAIGPDHQNWEYGTEDAFTVIPNFLITGILVIMVSLGIAFFSLSNIRRANAEKVMLLLFILLILFGGGIGQIAFIPLAILATRRIDDPLLDYDKKKTFQFWNSISKHWFWFTIFGSIMFLTGLLVSITGYIPGVTNDNTILYLDWSCLLLGLLFWFISYKTSIVSDFNQRKNSV